MSKCPFDGSACCDDLCHGSGCMQMEGYPMIQRCDFCGGDIDEEIPDCSTCTCGEDDDDFYDFEPLDVPDDDPANDAPTTEPAP